MTYSVGGKIQASDYNGWISTSANNVNKIWGAGTGNYGYGQTSINTVAGGSASPTKIKAGTTGAGTAGEYWYQLLNKISAMASHQGSTITSQAVPVAGDKITYVSALPTNIDTITNNRLNAAAQGASSSHQHTNTVTWNDSLTFTATITFASAAHARYYFNAGGQIGVQSSHSSINNINQVVNLLAVNMGTVWFSSPIGANTATINGSTWTGVTRVANPLEQASTITQNNTWGFYNWNSTDTQVLRVEEDTYYYHAYGNDSYAAVYVSYNGATTATIKVVFDLRPDSPTIPPTVASGTSATIILRPPTTTHLSTAGGSNTWGTPSVSWTSTTA